MKRTIASSVFFIILIVNIVSLYTASSWLQSTTKVLLLIVLAEYFWTATAFSVSGLRKLVLAALFFSWVGDILLLFQPDAEVFFILGLSAFLLAHIFYIIFFNRIRIQEGIGGRWWLLLIVVVYYSLLMYILGGKLGSMAIPVRAYGVVLSFMCMLGLHLFFLGNKKAGVLIMTGAVLFVVSDSALAIDKFYESFEAAGAVIMVTYGLAQFFIVEGAIHYLSSTAKR